MPPEGYMDSTVVTTTIASASASAAAVVGLIIFLVTRELANSSQKLSLKLFSNRLGVFAIPLLIVFAFISIMWVAEIVT